jgi:hypothetical protein
MSAALFSPDILEFLDLLNRHKVRYLIVGGEAVVQYGYARFTGDTDVFYDAEASNAGRLYGALLEFWRGAVPGIDSVEALQKAGRVFQFGRPPNRLDLLNAIDGVSFPAAWRKRKTVRVRHAGRTQPLHFIGLRDLIRNKRSIGRARDLEDLRYLTQALKRQQRGPRPPRRPRGQPSSSSPHSPQP